MLNKIYIKVVQLGEFTKLIKIIVTFKLKMLTLLEMKIFFKIDILKVDNNKSLLHYTKLMHTVRSFRGQ